MNSLGINQYSYQRRPISTIVWSWVGALVSLLLLIPAGGMVVADISAYRSCSINTSGLTVSACGKHSVDVSDLIIIGLFIGTVLLVICAVTHALRMSRKTQ
ncbi:MAG: hypothetical protein QFB87_03105 [Patescibacteria group bacterium]|nr:hypothetical protein [Patescibacteria group bacterium]